jgi:acetolactate synthase I/II/III large subunit
MWTRGVANTVSKLKTTDGQEVRLAVDEPAEAMLASMKLNGIDRLWFVSGTEIAPLQEGAVKNAARGLPTPKIMTMTHESVALAAACGETVVTGRAAATAFHVDVGLLNAGGSIHNADRGRHPVLIMSGAPPTADRAVTPGGRTSQVQWIQQVPDQGGIVRQYVRWDHRLAAYDNAGMVVTRAAQVMLSEPQGPAYLALPREALMSPVTEACFPLLDRLRVPTLATVDVEALGEVADLLLQAQDPLICVSRTGRSEAALPLLVELAELIGARVMSDLANRLAFPATHHLYQGTIGYDVTPPETDCLLALDVLVPWMPSSFMPEPGTAVIRIALDPVERLAALYDFPSGVSLAGDPVRAVADLVEVLRIRMRPEDHRRVAQRTQTYRGAAVERRASLVDKADKARANGVIHPLLLSRTIGALDPETIICQELAETALLDRTLPGTLFGPYGSSIGFMAPMAVGIKTAAPDRRVVATVGDGSWMFSNPQVCTWASRFHAAPVLFVVSNNRGYRTGTYEVARTYPNGYSERLNDFTGGVFGPEPNFAGEAAASGCFGERVTDPDRLESALARAVAAVDGGTTAVLDVQLPEHAPRTGTS